jgi:predicted nucleic acid-binding protein
VSLWLSSAPLDLVPISELQIRARRLAALGLDRFDSLHVASAELAGADVFVTVDYPLLSRARKTSSELQVRVTDPLRFAEEVFRDFIHH